MFSRETEFTTGAVGPTPRFALSRTAFTVSAFALEVVSILLVAMATGAGYHVAAYSVPGEFLNYAAVGILAGLVFGLIFIVQDEYSVESLLEGRRSNSRLFFVWNLAFGALALIGFLSKSTADYSRGWLLLFYLSGAVAVVALNALLHRSLGTLIERGLVRRRRLMLVGGQDEIARMEREISDGSPGIHVAGRVVLPGEMLSPSENGLILDAAIGNARILGVEDVVISTAWNRAGFIEKAISAFSVLPVVIHLGTDGLIGQFKHARVSHFGKATTLTLTREPLAPFEALSKRAFDIFFAGLALLLLLPLFGLVALLIKLDSAGPVFFRQRRRGFNLEKFRMWKFRTMTTLDDGENIEQAKKNDSRVTALGKHLRRLSIDELPQLLNVLRGEMSLVGPRPHAVAHDMFFEKRISLYPRRLNVKPGITGWAQVNGFRGATETDDSMRLRVEHDLYYIDNWSLSLDLYIILLTVFSRKTQKNAY